MMMTTTMMMTICVADVVVIPKIVFLTDKVVIMLMAVMTMRLKLLVWSIVLTT